MKLTAISLADNPHAGREVTECLQTHGFAVVRNHGTNPDFFTRLYDTWRMFFASNALQYYEPDLATQAGFYGLAQAETAKGHTVADIKEYFQYRPGCNVPEAVRLQTAECYDRLFCLAQRMLFWVQRYTPASLWNAIDEPLSGYLCREQSLARILHYPPLSGAEQSGATRAAAHEDIDFITLLPAATTGGLEIRPKGSDWMAVQAEPGEIIVNIGDMLQELTQGALPSTTHRVVNPPSDRNTRRITAPLFCHPLNSLRLSERHTAGSYLEERLREINAEGLKPK